MAVTKEKKKEILEKISEIVKNSASIVFVNFHGLGVADANAMRGELRGKGVRYLVAKKTLVKRALTEAKTDGDMPQLDGELALVYGEDPTAPAREVNVFVKKFNGTLSILGGIFENVYKDGSEMKEIALIPSLDVLRGQFVNIINSPIQGFAVALSEIAKKKETQ